MTDSASRFSAERPRLRSRAAHAETASSAAQYAGPQNGGALTDPTGDGEPAVRLNGVWKVFGKGVVAVRDLSLEIAKGEVVSLLGPSGCGKTTTLRLLAGFETPTAGDVRLGDRDLRGVAPKDRQIGMVFQQYALFPHLTVFENIAFGLRVRGVPRDVVRQTVAERLQLVRLSGHEERMSSQLSGGEQQRVALARALATEPQVLLLDEPLGALDRKLREEMQLELKGLLRKVGITALIVTHDQDEALTMSDRVAVMDGGVIQQLATPEVLYEQPRTAFVAGFVGVSNIFSGRITPRRGGSAVLDTDGMTLVLPEVRPGCESGAVAVRPEKVEIWPAPGGDAEATDATYEATNAFPAVVRSVKYLGISTEYRVELPGGGFAVAHVLNATAERRRTEGEPVVVRFPVEHVRLLEEPDEPAGPLIAQS